MCFVFIFKYSFHFNLPWGSDEFTNFLDGLLIWPSISVFVLRESSTSWSNLPFSKNFLFLSKEEFEVEFSISILSHLASMQSQRDGDINVTLCECYRFQFILMYLLIWYWYQCGVKSGWGKLNESNFTLSYVYKLSSIMLHGYIHISHELNSFSQFAELLFVSLQFFYSRIDEWI